MGSPPCKILGTIFKMDKGGKTNWPKNKVDDDVQVSRKGGKELASIEDWNRNGKKNNDMNILSDK